MIVSTVQSVVHIDNQAFLAADKPCRATPGQLQETNGQIALRVRLTTKLQPGLAFKSINTVPAAQAEIAEGGGEGGDYSVQLGVGGGQGIKLKSIGRGLCLSGGDYVGASEDDTLADGLRLYSLTTTQSQLVTIVRY